MSNFIMIKNGFITEGHEQHLTKEELGIFILLSMSKDLNDEVYCTLSVLHEKSKEMFGSSKKRSMDKIKESIAALQGKGIVTIDDVENFLEAKANTLIIVKVNKVQPKEFTKLSVELYNLFTKLEHIYVYLATHRWAMSGNGAFTCSFERWAKILQCTERTAINYINEAVEKQIIYKNIGDYNEFKKQNVNQYKTTRFESEEKTIHTKKQDELTVKRLSDSVEQKEKQQEQALYEKVMDYSTQLNLFTTWDLNDAYERFSKYTDESGKNVFPIVQDYAIILELNKALTYRILTEFESAVHEAGSNRIKVLEKNPNTKQILEDMLKKAKRYLVNLELQQNIVIANEQMNYPNVDDMFAD